jgi:predicted small metal-binding protein
VEHEVREQHAPLASGEAGLDAPAVDLERERAAELDPDAVLCHCGANIVPTATRYNGATTREEHTVSKQINCECGYVARGDSEAEVIGTIREHMRSDHPELLEQVSDDDLRGWIEET